MLPFLHDLLKSHPNRDFINNISTGLWFGFRVVYKGYWFPRVSSNLPSTTQQPEVIEANLLEEVKERAYLSLACPVCEYGSITWSPYTQKDIVCIESVQRRAVCFGCNDYCRSSSVNTKLSNLGWQDIETRRKITNLTMFCKIKTGNVRMSSPNDLR